MTRPAASVAGLGFPLSQHGIPPRSLINVSFRIGTFAPQSSIMRATLLCRSLDLLALLGISGPAPSQCMVTVTIFLLATSGSSRRTFLFGLGGLGDCDRDRFIVLQDTAGPFDNTADCNKSSWYAVVRICK